MKLKVFSVYDSKVAAFMAPFFLRTSGEAIRGIQQVVNSKDAPIAQHPEDYTLFELGEFNDESASFKLHATPVSLGVAIQFKEGA